MYLTVFFGSFVSSKLTEIAILDVLVGFWLILVAEKWQNTKWRQFAPNLGPCHALAHYFESIWAKISMGSIGLQSQELKL